MRLWIAGTLSIGLVVLLTVLGAAQTGQAIWSFLALTLVLVGLMILTAKGRRWARWLVTAMLLFFAVSVLRAATLLGIALAAVFVGTAVVFFTHRAGTAD